jgi:hypothetical protein
MRVNVIEDTSKPDPDIGGIVGNTSPLATTEASGADRRHREREAGVGRGQRGGREGLAQPGGAAPVGQHGELEHVGDACPGVTDGLVDAGTEDVERLL